METSHFRMRLAAAIAAGCAACRSTDAPPPPAPASIAIDPVATRPSSAASAAASASAGAHAQTQADADADARTRATNPANTAGATNPANTAGATNPAGAVPSPSSPTATPDAAPRACSGATTAERYCLDRGAKPPRMVPNPTFTFDARRCVVAAEIPDHCSGISAVLSGPDLATGRCCYTICRNPTPPPCGRPLVDDFGRDLVARIEPAPAWRAPRRAALAPGSRAHVPGARVLRDAWLADAAAEHASIASFGRFALELMAVGAPPDMIEAAHRAALDEIEHARLCLAVAAAHDAPVTHATGDTGTTPVGLGALPLRDITLRADLASVAASAAEESCCGEAFAALAAARARDACADTAVTDVLARIAEDEARHAELGFRFVAWAWAEGDAVVRSAVERGFARGLERLAAATPPAPDTPDAGNDGRLGRRDLACAARDAREQVILPCLARLRAAA